MRASRRTTRSSRATSRSRSQQEFLAGILRDFGFEEGAYRLDPTVHPFATSFSRTDIRMTTRYKPTNLRALWAAMHEAGHGLTYQGVDPALGRTPLYGNASLGLGESQSRSWENLVGRSLPFWRGRYPELQRLLPAARAGRPGDLVPRHQPRRARADPRRRRRGHLLAAHHPPLRAGAGARRGRARARRPAGGMERADAGAPRRRGARRRARRAPGRALDACVVRLLPHLRPRERALRPDLARRRAGAARPRRPARGGRVRPALRARSASGSTGTGASSRRWRRSSARSAPTRSIRSRTSNTCAARCKVCAHRLRS